MRLQRYQRRESRWRIEEGPLRAPKMEDRKSQNIEPEHPEVKLFLSSEKNVIYRVSCLESFTALVYGDLLHRTFLRLLRFARQKTNSMRPNAAISASSTLKHSH